MNAIHLRSLISRLNDSSRSSLEAAIAMCVSRGHHHVDLEHFLLRLIEQVDGDVANILRHFDVDTSRLTRDLSRGLDRFQTGNTRAPAFAHRGVAVCVGGLRGRSGSLRSHLAGRTAR